MIYMDPSELALREKYQLKVHLIDYEQLQVNSDCKLIRLKFGHDLPANSRLKEVLSNMQDIVDIGSCIPESDDVDIMLQRDK